MPTDADPIEARRGLRRVAARGHKLDSETSTVTSISIAQVSHGDTGKPPPCRRENLHAYNQKLCKKSRRRREIRLGLRLNFDSTGVLKLALTPLAALAMALLGAALAWLLTGLMRRYALSAQLLDTPNDRSMHTVPTPRGGGVAIVVSFAALAIVLHHWGSMPPGLLPALLGGGGLVALVGFIDDQRPLKARWRFMAHSVSAAWLLWLMKGIPPVPMLGLSIDLGWFGAALAAVYIVWMVNLCNFMDGIDGIASVEAITAALGGALCWWLATGTSHWAVPAVFAGCVAGFLAWNYPPAKIFMGDAGSGFLGLVLSLFSLWTAQQVPQVFWCWFILFGCFMADATTTLIRRVRRGERFSVAHRSHAFQYASRKLGSHKAVTQAVGAINLLWLLPLALLVATGRVDGLLGSIVAYAPLVWIAFRYKAGDRAAQEV